MKKISLDQIPAPDKTVFRINSGMSDLKFRLLLYFWKMLMLLC